MATSKKIRKGGVFRWVLQGVQQNDSFQVPHGTRIRYFAVEPVSLLGAASNLTVGVTPGTYTTATFTVNSVASATTGTLTWGGGASGTITLASGDILTTTAVAAKIASSGATGGWIVTSNGATVNLISTVPANLTAPTIALGTATNITFSSVTTVAGAVDATIVAAAAITTTKQVLTAFTPAAGKDYVAGTLTNSATFALTVSSATTGTIIVCGQPIVLASGDVDTSAHLATKIGGSNIPGYTLSPSSSNVTITQNALNQGIPFPTIAFGTATGITYSQSSSVSADPTYYINFSATSAPGNVNIYIVLETLI